jgi:hypothetical protein
MRELSRPTAAALTAADFIGRWSVSSGYRAGAIVEWPGGR